MCLEYKKRKFKTNAHNFQLSFYSWDLPEFFLNKISKIRSGLGTQVCAPHPHLCAPHPLGKLFNGKHLLSFTPVSETTVREILNKSAPKICELGAITTDPFHLFECLDTVMPTLTAIMNKSLLSRRTGESLLNFVFLERITYYSALCFSQAYACLERITFILHYVSHKPMHTYVSVMYLGVRPNVYMRTVIIYYVWRPIS